MTTFASSRPRLRPYPHPGFTLVELLVVLGIITIIASIVVVGLSGVVGRSETTRTEARLSVLETMVENYRNATGTKVGQGLSTGARTLPSSAGGPLNLPNLSANTAAEVVEKFRAAGAPDNVMSRAQQAVAGLLSLPGNREMLNDQEGDFLVTTFTWTGMTDSDSGDGTGAATGLAFNDFTANAVLTTGIPTDATGMPVGFAPTGGLAVGVGGIGLPEGSWWQSANNPVLVARDGNAFFFAPGDDGDYSTHADNVYSRPVVGYDDNSTPAIKSDDTYSE